MNRKRDAIIRQRRKAGLTLDVIATEFDLSKERVRQIVGPGLRPNYKPQYELDRERKERCQQEKRERAIRAIQLYQSGLTLAEVGKCIGCGWGNVRRILIKEGFPRRTPGWPK